MSYSSGCRCTTGYIEFGQDLVLLISFLLCPGLGLPLRIPVLASSLGSGHGMEHSPVAYVVVADCPRALALRLEFPGWHESVLTPDSLYS